MTDIAFPSLDESAMEIPLTRGAVAIVDVADYERLSFFKWSLRDGYARRARRISDVPGKASAIMMHREVLCAPEGMLVDHANRNRLDNRKTNLRICTVEQNAQNSSRHKDARSPYRGVYEHRDTRAGGCVRYVARIGFNGNQLHLGRFITPEDAAAAYDVAARKLHCEFATLNFP